MSNEKVIIAFLEGRSAHTPTRDIPNGYYMERGQTLSTDGIELINYWTRMAYKKDNKVYLNVRKYSPTTTKIQGKISFLAHQYGYEVVEYKGEQLWVMRDI